MHDTMMFFSYAQYTVGSDILCHLYVSHYAIMFHCSRHLFLNRICRFWISFFVIVLPVVPVVYSHLCRVLFRNVLGREGL